MQIVDSVKTLLNGRFEMKDLGELHYILGIEVTRQANGDLAMSQANYVAHILDRFELNTAHAHDRAKHIDVKFHAIRQWTKEQILKITYISTNEMLADFLTKPVAKEPLRKLTALANIAGFMNGEG
ncbi:hypothetical protein IWW52_003214 [Coemansia sp. RSA 2704]|nr:hypothetical protein IWW52_003214 [Coemansia sp. RSA 2704]